MPQAIQSRKQRGCFIERLASIISNGLNVALHPGLTVADINRFLG